MAHALPMQFRIRAITADDARVIAGWRYEPPYDIYNFDRRDGWAELTDPSRGYVAVTDGRGVLIGFFCVGPEGRVPGCTRAGCYADEALDVGLGLRPELTGRGLGRRFFEAGIRYAEERFLPGMLRLTVATFNERAIRVYERVGFVRGDRCFSRVRNVETEFVVMRRPMRPAERE